jgi:hypothetical protein
MRSTRIPRSRYSATLLVPFRDGTATALSAGKPGPRRRLTLCRKVMGRRRGEPLDRIADVEVLAVRREPLDAITPADVTAEGFPGMTTARSSSTSAAATAAASPPRRSPASSGATSADQQGKRAT